MVGFTEKALLSQPLKMFSVHSWLSLNYFSSIGLICIIRIQKAYFFMNVVQLLVSFGSVSQKVIVESKEWYAAICFSAKS